MKKTIYLFTIILFFSAMSWAQPQSATAIVNSQKIMAKTKIGLAVQKKLMQLNKEKQATFIQKQNEIKALEKEALSPALNAETREKKGQRQHPCRHNGCKGYPPAPPKGNAESR